MKCLSLSGWKRKSENEKTTASRPKEKKSMTDMMNAP